MSKQSPGKHPTPPYQNPILARDVPDPDVIAFSGGGYAMVASSFDRTPGLPLWFSDDLVTWRSAGHAGGARLDDPNDAGVWAPALREHGGLLHVVWGDPDRGILAVSAPRLSGPWSPPRTIIAGRGLIDPCPFWDEDGRAFIVHAYARSRAGFNNRLDVVEVDPALTRAVGTPRVLIDGDHVPGCSILEGPKVYRCDGKVWIFAPAGGVEDGWQYAFRAPSIWSADWEHRIVLEQGGSAVNGPHQGAWVRGHDGKEWFLHFQATPVHGRVLHLQPLRWGEDGWPLIGRAVDGGPAEPVSEYGSARDVTPDVPSSVPGPDWFGRGALPSALVADASNAGFALQSHPTATLGLAVDARWRRTSLEVRSGRAEIAVSDDPGATLVVAVDRESARVALGEHSVNATAPVSIAIMWSDREARFHIGGIPLGDAVALAPRRWTGAELTLAARGPGPAVFTPVETELR
ncbi:glycoside hydrolase 43 family protein [Microbacterium gorillae]|uniref:glycoside hydrolase 43 family protein n=1 Tax=Microbacterium gorillae TaxID=1231063 RepID=UPI003D95E6B6